MRHIVEIDTHIKVFLEKLRGHFLLQDEFKCLTSALNIYYWQQLDEFERSLCFFRLGELYYDKADYANSIEFYKEALKIFKKTGRLKLYGFTSVIIGEVYFQNGELELSIEFSKQALPFLSETGDVDELQFLAACHAYLCAGSLYTENFTDGVKYCEKASCLFENTKNLFGFINSQINLGEVFLKQGNLKKAEEIFQNCLEVTKSAFSINIKILNSRCLKLLGEVNFSDSSKARLYFTESLKVLNSISRDVNISKDVERINSRIHEIDLRESLDMLHS